jgi:hypothetical protein
MEIISENFEVTKVEVGRDIQVLATPCDVVIALDSGTKKSVSEKVFRPRALLIVDESLSYRMYTCDKLGDDLNMIYPVEWDVYVDFQPEYATGLTKILSFDIKQKKEIYGYSDRIVFKCLKSHQTVNKQT